jgi:Mn2+/Fe2+ NRAMP family transporter
MSEQPNQIEQDRKMLADAQAKGTGATLGAFLKLSGPGWLQSAITLGGGSLAGALFLGAIGGVGMLWLQLMAIVMGVIMLSAISYVTLSTGERPFQAINNHINPALGWGWLIATSLANMIWCMPQFSLCFGALEKNLAPGAVGNDNTSKLTVSIVILVAVSLVLAMNARRGFAAKLFDWFLKGLVGMVVLCFFGVVAFLTSKGLLDWGAIFAGFIPDFSQWNSPTGEVAKLIQGLPEDASAFWNGRIVSAQRARMIGAAATAVGINMTFLMPYAMLQRGWDKPFRGLARFDLSTGMAIPYIIVTTCVVIASAHAFHGKADEAFLSNDPAVFQTSATFGGAKNTLLGRVAPDSKEKKFDNVPEGEQLALVTKMANLPAEEKKIAASLVQRNADQLAQTLAPLIGSENANLVFGIGVFGMGFSTIIILMLINGYVFCEALGKPNSVGAYAAGCLVAGIVGASWPMFWTGDSKFYLAIVTSNFGMMLLPVAYITFFMMMNSTSLMGKEKPTGGRMLVWNVLMGISVIGAVVAASGAIYAKITDTSSPNAVIGGYIVLGLLVIYAILIALGFVMKSKSK